MKYISILFNNNLIHSFNRIIRIYFDVILLMGHINIKYLYHEYDYLLRHRKLRRIERFLLRQLLASLIKDQCVYMLEIFIKTSAKK